MTGTAFRIEGGNNVDIRCSIQFHRRLEQGGQEAKGSRRRHVFRFQPQVSSTISVEPMAQGRVHQTKSRKNVQQPRIPLSQEPNQRKGKVRFIYTGNSSLTLTGIVSGKRYTFTRPGDIVEVDERDRNMLLAMPSLKEI